MLEQNSNKINWIHLSLNKNAIHLLGPLNYTKMKEQNKEFFEDLVSYVFNPLRITCFSEMTGMSEIEYLEII